MPAQADQTRYRVPAATTKGLEALLNKIEANQGDLIGEHEFDQYEDEIDLKAVVAQLPEGVTEDDLVGILRLAMLTECATESYANTITAIGRNYDAGWLSRFTERVWSPDEITHYTPYKMMLTTLGFSEEELDRDIKETQEKAYLHTGGPTPVHITTFGMIQEYLTDNYHGLIARMIKSVGAQAAAMSLRIKRRETLHTVWYRDMTALQVEANPRFVEYVAREIDTFDMPGASLVPELQDKGKHWQELMGLNADIVFRDLIRLMHEVLGSTRLTGELVMTLAAERNVELGPLSTRQISAALNRIGGNGYGLIGEAMLERVGLGYLFKRQAGKQDSGFAPYGGVQERIRSLVRSWISARIPTPTEVMLAS